MNKNALNKIISSFVIPKYPWIEEFSIQVYLDSPIEKYTVYYFVNPDDDGTFTVTSEMDDAKKFTRNLFNMLGPNTNQYLTEILFLVKYTKL